MPDPRTLLHLLNSAAEEGFPVLMTARTPPSRQSYKLADLGSRLRASEVVEIRAPEDELLALLLTRLTAERQLSLGIAVRNYLLTHLPRTAAAMREAVARLDRVAFDRGARLTRALAAGNCSRNLKKTLDKIFDIILAIVSQRRRASLQRRRTNSANPQPIHLPRRTDGNR